MPCYDIQTPGGLGIMCARGARRKRCFHCNKLGATLLCDGPVAVNKTCDRALCKSCAVSGPEDTDFCREHADLASPPEGSV